MLTASLSAVGTLLLDPADLGAAAPDPAQTLAHESSPASSVRRLDTGWEFRQGAVGIDEVWRAEEAAAGAGQGSWQVTALPHCFNAQDACDPDKSYFRGQGWYRTRLVLKNPLPDGRTILHFQGAGQTTSLWVGSQLIGTHKGGYDEFVFDITDAIEQSRHAGSDVVPIAVLCDNSPDRDRVPSELSDFCLYGGLYRHVNLVYVPQISLERVHVLATVTETGEAHVSVKARLCNPSHQSSPCTLSIQGFDPHGDSVFEAAQAVQPWTELMEIARFPIDKPARWSPEAPNLYRCRVTLSSSHGQSIIEERFGIRQVEFVDHGPFKLNGRRLLLRGTQRHADHAGVAAAMPDEQVREEMQLIRDMGANFIRLAHYQQDRLVLDLCDELGLMVWEEAPWCRAGIGSEAFQQNAKDMLSAMIDQHHNHPSVILWGLGNEDDWPDEYPSVDQQAIRAFMIEMRDLAHQLDSSRLTSFRRCDFARDIPDVYSPSIWAGWYRGDYREYEQSLLVERDRVKRFMHIEWGADSHARRHSEDPEAVLQKVAKGVGTDERGLDYLKAGGDIRVSKDGDWSETYACNLFDWHLKTQEAQNWLAGAAQWVFKDFASPLRGDNGIPRINQKGVVERDLTRKESYFVFQSYWAQKPMVHIYGHTWPVRWGKPGEKRFVHIYSNCDRVELFLNDQSQGVMHRNSQDFPAAGLRWQVAFAPGTNRLRAIATSGESNVSDEIELTYQTEPWDKPASIKLFQKEHNDRIVTVEAQLVDSGNLPCLDSAKLIRFSITGSGTLIDNLGTVRGSREVQLSNGRAQISIVRNGGCRLEAAPEGLAAAYLDL